MLSSTYLKIKKRKKIKLENQFSRKAVQIMSYVEKKDFVKVYFQTEKNNQMSNRKFY